MPARFLVLQVVFRPAAGWEAVRAADPPWSATFTRVALPLAALPALAWPFGQVMDGDLAMAAAPVAAVALNTLALCLLSVLLLAAAFFVLARWFEAERRWRRAVALAAYAASPVLLTGALLVMPVLIAASVAACVHTCALCYLGVQRLLDCPEGDAAFFVAAAVMFWLVATLIAGGLCSAAGLI